MAQESFELKPVTSSRQAEILAQASIPEHVLPLMTAISGGESYLLDDHLVLMGEGWAILVGYPLKGEFSAPRLMAVIDALRTRNVATTLHFIAPEIPPDLMAQCQSHDEDEYLVLPLETFHMTSKLRRAVHKGGSDLMVVKTHAFEADHQALVDELEEAVALPPMVKGLYEAMPRYLHASGSGWILEGRDRQGKLAAFFVVDGGARHFDIYLLGAHSRLHEVPYASDVLFKTMIDQAWERGKESLQLGLGVNPGIRRFKEKWGGQAWMPYHACRMELKPPGPLTFLDSLLETLT